MSLLRTVLAHKSNAPVDALQAHGVLYLRCGRVEFSSRCAVACAILKRLSTAHGKQLGGVEHKAGKVLTLVWKHTGDGFTFTSRCAFCFGPAHVSREVRCDSLYFRQGWRRKSRFLSSVSKKSAVSDVS